MIRHVVRAGETISSIAFHYGFFPDTLWQLAENAELRETRGSPDILAVGDVVAIPSLRGKQWTGATGQRHRFRRKGVPARTRMQVFAGDRPRAHQYFTLRISGLEQAGETDGDGVLEAFIPPAARRGVLVIGPEQVEIEIAFGQLDPITELSGVQQRLSNLGFRCSDSPGELGSGTAAALRRFQARLGLEPSGELDDQTRDALRRIHDQRGELPRAPEPR